MEPFGASLMLLGVCFGWASIWAWQTMQSKVSKYAPPSTNGPLRNLRAAFNTSNRKRVFQEYARLFPESKQREFERVSTILAFVCFVAGSILLIAFSLTRG
jgi:hypothetical protein